MNDSSPIWTTERLHEERAHFERRLYAENTLLGYQEDWKLFCKWAQKAGYPTLPASPETVARYLTQVIASGRKVTSAIRYTSGIGYFHKQAGHPNPVTAEIWKLLTGARRLRREQPRQMRPLTVDHLRSISAALNAEGTLHAFRDRAILVLGFSSALRRANLAALELRDVEFHERGLIVRVHREKNNQAGRTRLIGIPRGQHPHTCAERCLTAWLDRRGHAPGPLFTRIDRKSLESIRPVTVGRAVKAGVERIGLQPQAYGGHSLRAGFITAAVEANIEPLRVAAVSGHRSMDILQRYFRPTDLWRANCCSALGL